MTYAEIEKRMFDLKWEFNSLGLDVWDNKEYKRLIKLRALHESNKLRRSIAGYYVEETTIHYVTLLEELDRKGLVVKLHAIEKKSLQNTEISLEQIKQCSDDDTDVYSSMEELDEEISFYLFELEDNGIFRVL